MAVKVIIGRLAALKTVGVRAWRSLRGTRQRVEAAVAFVAAIACVVAAGLQVAPAFAETKIEGEPVPADLLPAIVVGATSCPALTGPRLAAQLMAASAFKPSASSGGGQGLAGLDSAEWKTWAPWDQAQRSDVLANVLALAHRTCKTIGQVRDAGVDDELWEAAVAADVAGLAAVKKAGGVPDSAQKDVDTLVGYANWYADEPEFDGDAKATDSSATVASAKAVPDAYVDLVVRAGRICPSVLPAPRVAAQLMALSAFNPNLRGPNGGQGIAQFTDAMWKRYRPSADASVWDPQAAIPAMGTAICDLNNQVSGMRTEERSNDPYTLAIAAYQWGITAVRAEGGVPRDASVTQLSDLVTGYVEGYSGDARLRPAPVTTVKPTAKATPPKVTPSSEASAPPKPEEPEKPAATKTKPAAPAPKTWDPATSWQLTNSLNGRVADVPGDDNTTAAGTTIQLWDNQKAKDQYWHIANKADAQWVVITNAFTGKALGIKDASGDNGAQLVMLDPDTHDRNQHWRLQDAGDGKYFVVNRRTGKALDITGDDCCGDNGAPIQQWDRQDYAVDQHWTLTR